MRKPCLADGAFVAMVLSAASVSAQPPARAQTFPLRDTAGLIAPGVKTEAVSYLGRDAVRITIVGEDGGGLVFLPGTDFQDGVIDVDIALRATTPPGVPYPGFVGIAFRVRPDASRYELFYLRPGNADSADQAKRNHSVQYVSEPGFGWYRLRREWPSVYESHADLALETWTRVRIEVAGRAAKLFVNGSGRPSLVVDGLKGEDLHGAVGLWGYTNQESYFSNVRITPAAPARVTNGSEVAGAWEMTYLGDAGRFGATVELHRDGDKVTGTCSGPLGQGRPVTGTWRAGYVELAIPVEWPKEAGQGAPGPVTAYLAGWIDGDSGKGRMRVEGRSDGVWTAKRKD
ncbi:MAG TPA: hypothetical protein VMX54_19395 [Vicinamibacteria bacterium]|nr:hypothetical protein [Vicinamibacteria bacterium]